MPTRTGKLSSEMGSPKPDLDRRLLFTGNRNRPIADDENSYWEEQAIIVGLSSNVGFVQGAETGRPSPGQI